MFPDDLVAERRKFAVELAFIVTAIRQFDRFVAAAAALGERHARRYWRAGHVQTAGIALLDALRSTLDGAWSRRSRRRRRSPTASSPGRGGGCCSGPASLTASPSRPTAARCGCERRAWRKRLPGGPDLRRDRKSRPAISRLASPAAASVPSRARGSSGPRDDTATDRACRALAAAGQRPRHDSGSVRDALVKGSAMGVGRRVGDSAPTSDRPSSANRTLTASRAPASRRTSARGCSAYSGRACPRTCQPAHPTVVLPAPGHRGGRGGEGAPLRSPAAGRSGRLAQSATPREHVQGRRDRGVQAWPRSCSNSRKASMAWRRARQATRWHRRGRRARPGPSPAATTAAGRPVEPAAHRQHHALGQAPAGRGWTPGQQRHPPEPDRDHVRPSGRPPRLAARTRSASSTASPRRPASSDACSGRQMDPRIGDHHRILRRR